MKSIVAGTFNVLHSGHKALIDRAFSIADNVLICITSDEMSSPSRNFVNPYYLRKKAVEEYASTKSKGFSVVKIEDMYGPMDRVSEDDVLVVSEETLENGKKVVEKIKEKFDVELKLSIVPIVVKKDGIKLSSSDIITGKCARNGDFDAIKIAVGSTNPVKVEAVRTVMESIYTDVIIVPTDVKSNVPEQPREKETLQGAKNRAVSAIGDCDLSVGIEAGVFEREDGLYDVQNCAILDRNGRFTYGTGSGFRYPDEIAELVRKGLTVGEAVKKIYNDDAGNKQGAVGILTKGLLDRKSLTEQSVMAAMIPRIGE